MSGDSLERDTTGIASERIDETTSYSRVRDVLVAKLGENPIFITRGVVDEGDGKMDILFARLGGIERHTAHVTMRPNDGGYELELEQVIDCGTYESITRYVVTDKANGITAGISRRPFTQGGGFAGGKAIGPESPAESYDLEPSDADALLGKLARLDPRPAFRKRCITTFG